MTAMKYDRIEKVTMLSDNDLTEYKDVYILTGDNIENDFEIDITFMNFIRGYYIIKREVVAEDVEDLDDVLRFTHYRRIQVPIKLDREHLLFWVDCDGWFTYGVAYNLELLGEHDELEELGWI